MGQQIIKQPNGKYCLFSSIVDNITDYNMSKNDIIEKWTNEAKEKNTKSVNNIIGKIKSGKLPYHQSTLDYYGMLDTIRDIHGEEEVSDIKDLIETLNIDEEPIKENKLGKIFIEVDDELVGISDLQKEQYEEFLGIINNVRLLYIAATTKK